jgi:N6-L-threonylcarbamoyladenine synthase
VLVAKSRQALQRTGSKRLAVGGGVAANRCLRSALEQMTREVGVELFIPPLALCTDNAAMAAMAVEKWRRQEFSPLDLDATPMLLTEDRLQLGSTSPSRTASPPRPP